MLSDRNAVLLSRWCWLAYERGHWRKLMILIHRHNISVVLL